MKIYIRVGVTKDSKCSVNLDVTVNGVTTEQMLSYLIECASLYNPRKEL